MDFDFTPETIGLIIAGTVAGFFTARAMYQGDIRTYSEMIDYFQEAYNRASGRYLVERDLNEGLTQELAAQAKLVK